MKIKILQLIKEYDSIIIARHNNPDYDAYGSQFGLYYALKEFYQNKKIYVVGDTNPLNYFEDLQTVSEEIYKKSLVFILDTVSSQMLDKEVYQNYNKLVLIDHHRNKADINYDLIYQDIEASSAAEIITYLLLDWNIPINKKAARALYIGIIGDTGRFMYSNTSARTFEMAAKLINTGISIAKIHNEVYLDTKRNKEIKNLFFSRIGYTKNNLAFCKNDKEFLIKHDLSSNYVSRGLVNQMAGMIEIPIWSNFTFDTNTGKIKCELRSRDIEVLSIAKKYGGGGHLNACGCSLNNWKEVDSVIKDLDNLLEEKNEN